ncbi:hypothetical protein BYZ73_02820 [Rhodovulum viride]|uniref:Transposase IS66 zinc-finger binding domain-containing protein n=2 Tax=Rhodovulum viride TaxID=1231134 RepID=A0ABX9DMY4_9RHOB|nr:hypothetical protein BYZ73_02820 [Rhodovulum viride]
MRKTGKNGTEGLDTIPARLRFIGTMRPRYACRTCTSEHPTRRLTQHIRNSESTHVCRAIPGPQPEPP